MADGKLAPFLYAMLMRHDRDIKALKDGPLPFEMTVWFGNKAVRASFFSPEDRVALGMHSLEELPVQKKRRLE